CQQHNTFPPSF
nr:immunoglobulin light chain junction region [Macaca mulatta]MOW08602.1 immunoglobulin light chain junction region [Macaca mulatta]MOW10803.1 immunoglobulin light chain junction region [Macaca mulatta]